MSRLNLSGHRFGRLVALHRGPSVDHGKNGTWVCECDCGNTTTVRTHVLRRGGTKSCGCYQSEMRTTHGKYQSRAHVCWDNMIQRCTNPENPGYDNYGGREISVCEKWMAFEGFYEDMGDPPKGRTLDRIDNDGDYEPENCRWATTLQQGRNKRDNRVIEFDGEQRCLSEWAEVLGMKVTTLRYRLNNWPVERALTEPVHAKSTPNT